MGLLGDFGTFCWRLPHPVPMWRSRLRRHQHYRACCSAHHFLAHATEQGMVNVAMAVRPHDDEVCIYSPGFRKDGRTHCARDEAGNNMNTFPPQLIGEIPKSLTLQA